MQDAELLGLEISTVISNRRHFMLAECDADEQTKNCYSTLQMHD